jgi:hypothetical protein
LESYARWEHWTLTEGQALGAADWKTLAKCQEEKASLEPVILRLTEAAEGEWVQLGMAGASVRAQVRSRIEALIALEKSNQATLAQRYEDHLRKKRDLRVARRNLGHVQRCYLNHLTPTWQSYS